MQSDLSNPHELAVAFGRILTESSFTVRTWRPATRRSGILVLTPVAGRLKVDYVKQQALVH